MNGRSTGLYCIALMALVCLVAAYVIERDFLSVYLDFQESAQNVEAREEERDRVASTEKKLATKLGGLASDSFIQEKEFRDRGFLRQGETIYEATLADAPTP